MVEVVESVVGRVHVECISERESSGGKYQSVTIGPVWVESADQVRGTLA
jgi:putative lipoic acid-binding regulatory protein